MSEKENDNRLKPDTENHDEDDVPQALDGGWAWVILFASFMSSVIVDGVCFSFGIFFLEYLDHFQENKGKTAWIGSVLNGMYMIMGPIAAALANKFGCRPVAIVGSIWSTIAFFASTYSPTIDILIVTYGVLGGMGFGLMYLPSIVIVGFYFDKRRALATGIATCGSGIGAFIFAPMCQALIQTYAWRGAQWILAAIVLNGVVLGALYRPLTQREVSRYFNRKWHGKRKKDHAELSEDEDQELENNHYKHSFIYKPHVKNEAQHSMSLGNLTESDAKSPSKYGWPSQPEMIKGRSGSVRMPVDSWHNLAAYGSVNKLNAVPEVTYHSNTLTGSSVQSPTSKKAAHTCLHVVKDIFKEVSKSMDISVLKNPVFVIYGISCILCMKGFFVPFIYLVDKAVEIGYSKTHAAALLSILGITNTVGRVLAGWVSDRPWADCLLINNISLIIGGLCTMLVPFLSEFWLLAIYASVFGLCIAAFVSLRSIILVDLIGIKRLTSSFGILVMCQGISSFVGAPIAGSLFDLTGTYNVSFFVAGISIMLAGIICLPLRRIGKWRSEKSTEPSEASSVKSTDVTECAADSNEDAIKEYEVQDSPRRTRTVSV